MIAESFSSIPKDDRAHQELVPQPGVRGVPRIAHE